ncbi:MAG: hypothetical protein EOO08_13270 [Chitinophagaceae bacterium]|nr:MAG: hypothetical protein EOO08_13270 [Chitinophagaceae bacterium]
MKKSKQVQLVLITAALASCHQQQPQKDWEGGTKTYVRSDSTAPYSRTHYGGTGLATAALWYYAFRPYGNYAGNRYTRAGYYSGAIPRSSNVGSNSFKGRVSRGGFGRGGYSASS